MFSHDGLNAYCPMCGENIIMGGGSPERVVQGWMNSPGHRANILRDGVCRLGVAYYVVNGVVYAVQEFSY